MKTVVWRISLRSAVWKREQLVLHTYVAGCISNVPISPQRDNAVDSRHFSFATCRENAEYIYNTGNPPRCRLNNTSAWRRRLLVCSDSLLPPVLIMSGSENHLHFFIVKHKKKQCLSLEFSAPTARVSTQFRQVNSVSAGLPTVSQRDYSVKLIDKEKQPDKTIPDCSWSTASLSEPEWLEKRRVLEPTGDSYGLILVFTSLFWKSAEFLFSPKGLKTYGMLFHASSVHSMDTWVLENNQPFLWHGDDGTQTQSRNLLGNFANISRNVLGCANGTEADHQRVRTDTGSFQDSTTLSNVDLSDKNNHLLAINYQKHAIYL